ncbi:MAG: dihydrodipicolinate synthase family protein [Phycisphaerales bacterium]
MPTMTLDWRGVLPAITTPFERDGCVDYAILSRHAAWLAKEGSRAIVALGSLGEGGTLEPAEKERVLATLVEHAGVPVVAGVGAMSTQEAVRIARVAERQGCMGLMVLPPYAYCGSWRETKEHFAAVMDATGLSCMLYNNPIAYGTDTTPTQIAELAMERPTLHAVKESSADVRRVTALRSAVGERLALLVGVDDLLVEGVAAGATGWIAGLANAFPRESVELLNLSLAGRTVESHALYSWFLPLLHMDVVPEFVHLIKLVMQEVHGGRLGSEDVRPPRLRLDGAQREAALATIRRAMATRPAV